MNNSLESHKFFPYIAWIVVIGFALFTYTLTTRLNQEITQISSDVERLEQRLDAMDTTGTRTAP